MIATYSVALFAALKQAWDAANLTSQFPGGYVAGERINKPAALPALMPWPMGETPDRSVNVGQYGEVEFEVAILGKTFEQCGDPTLAKALGDATEAVTDGGPVALGRGVRLVAIMPVVSAVRFAEFAPDLFVCFLTFRAKLSQ